jgi:hypothetical protein
LLLVLGLSLGKGNKVMPLVQFFWGTRGPRYRTKIPTQYVDTDGSIKTFDLADNWFCFEGQPGDNEPTPSYTDDELMQIMHFYMGQIFGALFTTDANLVMPPEQLVYGGGTFDVASGNWGMLA